MPLVIIDLGAVAEREDDDLLRAFAGKSARMLATQQWMGCGSSSAHTGRGRAPPLQPPIFVGAGLVPARASSEKSHTRGAHAFGASALARLRKYEMIRWSNIM